MRIFKNKDQFVREAVRVAHERVKVSKDLALATAAQLATSRLPPGENVDENQFRVPFTAILIDTLRNKVSESEEIDLSSWANPPKDPLGLAPLDTMLGELQAQDAAARSVGPILAGRPKVTGDPTFGNAFSAATTTPTQPPPSSFALPPSAAIGIGSTLPLGINGITGEPIAKGPTGAASDATTTPSWAAAPISTLSASLLAMGDTTLRKAELRQAADAQINAAVTKSLAAHAASKIAKTAGRTIRVIKVGS